ncbi:MAG: AAA family ATPase [Crocinitomix sp.]|nr:AAA family ATPase [Crocinitomix sp.]
MHIQKIIINNFKCFKDEFILELDPRLNVLVGDNEVGKSTILEAVHLCLSGFIQGKNIRTDLDQNILNKDNVTQYLTEINIGKNVPLPELKIELFIDFEDEEMNQLFTGDYNSTKSKACGILFKIKFDSDKYQDVYNQLINEIKTQSQEMNSIPIEYYEYSWKSFARKEIVPRLIPLNSSLVDSTSAKYRNGSDIYISNIIKESLLPEEEIKISQAHRKLKDVFAQNNDIKLINEKINQGAISDKLVSIEVDLSTKTSWETSLVTCINGIPFHQVGKGEQAMVKTKLALQEKNTKSSNILLIEEPENHLSHSKLNKLINFIKSNNLNKQIIITSHSSFVSNKLGLNNLILLNKAIESENRTHSRITNLKGDTQKYFQKLSGYDTLRLILSSSVILVEGDSDELIIQRAYFDEYGVLPIENNIDVITVRGLAFKRYLYLAESLQQKVMVVTDNDGDFDTNIIGKYSDFSGIQEIIICADNNNELPSLEEQIIDANKTNLQLLSDILSTKSKTIAVTYEAILDYMKKNKTESALAIFESDKKIIYPSYILQAIKNQHE